MGFLSKLKKRVTDELDDAKDFTLKRSGKAFDFVRDVAERPSFSVPKSGYNLSKVMEATQNLNFNAGMPSNSYSQPASRAAAKYGGRAASTTTDVMDYGTQAVEGAFTYRFAEPRRKRDGGLEADFSLGQIKQGLTSPFGNTREWRDELKRDNGGESLGFRDRLSALHKGGQYHDESNLPQGVKTFNDFAMDPTMYIPAGTIGNLSLKAGLGSTKLGKLALGSGKIGATSRSARIAGGLLEGAGGRGTFAMAAGAGGLSQLAEATPWEKDDAFAGLAGGLLGGTAKGIFDNRSVKAGIDEEEFNTSMERLRKMSMDSDPEIASSAERQMEQLGQLRSQGLIKPSKKIPRSAKLDEMTDDEVNLQWDFAMKSDADEDGSMTSEIYRDLSKKHGLPPAPLRSDSPEVYAQKIDAREQFAKDNPEAWDRWYEDWEKVSKQTKSAQDNVVSEKIRRADKDVKLYRNYGNRFITLISSKEMGEPDEYGNVYPARYYEEATPPLELEPRDANKHLVGDGDTYSIRDTPEAKEWWINTVKTSLEKERDDDYYKPLKEYLESVETRRASEGGKGFFGEYKSLDGTGNKASVQAQRALTESLKKQQQAEAALDSGNRAKATRLFQESETLMRQAMSGMRSLNGAKGIISDKSGDVFRDLTKHIESTPNLPYAAPGTQWKQILNAKGVTKRELEWNGLDDEFFASGKITKQDVLNRIKENDFDIEEHIADSKGDFGAGRATYGNYTVPGGDRGTYREIILSQKPNQKEGIDPMDWEDVPYATESVAHDLQESVTLMWNKERTHFINYSPQGRYMLFVGNPGEDKRLVQGFDTKEEAIDHAANMTSERTSNNQWQQPQANQGKDILAHIRVDDRDGGRTLFVHEIQSDWAQENRSGKPVHVTHRNTPDKELTMELQPASETFPDTTYNVRGLRNNPSIEQYWSGSSEPKWVIMSDIGRHKADNGGPKMFDTPEEAFEYLKKNAINPSNAGGNFTNILADVGIVRESTTHPHPFQNNWQDLALKRIVRYAADNGYDQIKLASGEQTLKIPGMGVIGDAAEGRKRSYNEIIPSKIRDIAKKFDLQVEKVPAGGEYQWTPTDITPGELKATLNYARSTDDVPTLDTQDAVEKVLEEMENNPNESLDRILNRWFSAGGGLRTRSNYVGNFLSLNLEQVPVGENTVVKLTPELRDVVTSRPQTMFSVVGDGDANADPNAIKRMERQKRLSEMSGGSPEGIPGYLPTTRSERDVLNQAMESGIAPQGTNVDQTAADMLAKSGQTYRDPSSVEPNPNQLAAKLNVKELIARRYLPNDSAADFVENIPTEAMPTLKEHLEGLIWAAPDPIRKPGSEGRLLKKLEGQRNKAISTAPEFGAPQAPPMGDWRLRAEELLATLDDESLAMKVPTLEVADLVASVVGGRDMERILTDRAGRAAAYRRLQGNAQGTRPLGQPLGVMGEGGPAAPRTHYTTPTSPEQEIQTVVDITDTLTGAPPTPPSTPVDKVSFLDPDEAKASMKYVHDIRSMSEEAEHVKSWKATNPIVKAIAPLMGLVNPSVLLNTPIGRLVVAKARQELTIDELSSLPLAAFDKMAGFGGIRGAVGKYGSVFKTDDKGIVQGVNKHWNDVFSNIETYKDKMTPQQLTYATTFKDVLDEVKMLRAIHVLPNLPKDVNGEIWVPRVVRGIDNIEIVRPTNHKAKRLWESATEGAKNGVDYADPRETLNLYLRETYREILDQEFARAIRGVSDEISSLVHPNIKARVDTADAAFQAAKANVKSAAEMLARDKTNEDLRKIMTEVRAKANAAKVEKLKADKSMELALETLKKQEVNKSYRTLADGTKEPISTFPIKGAGERVVSREDAKLLRDYIGMPGAGGAGTKEINESPVSKVFGAVGSTLRTMTSTLDVATPFIHNLPLMTENPKAWTRAIAGNYTAMINPRFRDQYVHDNLKTIQEMAIHGISPGTNEYYEALGRGGPITSGLDKVLGDGNVRGSVRKTGKQTVGRLEAAMSTNLLIGRTELWKANYDKYAAEGNLDGLAQFVRNISGANDSRRLMVGKGQRDQESFWLAFSPKLVRSIFSLGAMATNPTTQEGRHALRSLAVFTGTMMGGFYLANLAYNHMNGNPIDPMSEEALNPINPTAGKKFMSTQTPIGYIGIGGQTRAAMQLFGNSAKSLWNREPGNFTKMDQFDNPIMNWYTSRGAPGIQFGQDLIEATTGNNANPYAEINGPEDFFKEQAKNFMPFAAQNFLEAEDMKQGALMAGIGSFGPRYSPYSRAEVRDQRVDSMGFTTSDGKKATSINELNKEQKQQFYEKYPVEQITEKDNVTKMFNLIDEEQQSFDSDVAMMTLNVQRGLMTKEQFKDWYKDRNGEKFDRIDQVRSTFDVMPADRAGFTGSVNEYLNSKNTRPEDKAVAEYYAISSKTPLLPDGTVDFDGINRAKENMLRALPENQRVYVTKMVNRPSQTKENEMVTEYDIVKAITKPYFESDERIFNYFKQKSGFYGQFATYDAYEKFIDTTAMENGISPETFLNFLSSKIKDVNKFNDARSEYKRIQRLQNPQLDRALAEWYGMEPANKYDFILSGRGSDAGAALAPAIAKNKSLQSTKKISQFALSLPKDEYNPTARKYSLPKYAERAALR